MLELEPHKYVLLSLSGFNRINNTNSLIKKSFAPLPLTHFVQLPSNSIIGINKHFIKKEYLNSIEIKFLYYQKDIGFIDEELFDFNGLEHIFNLVITTNN